MSRIVSGAARTSRITLRVSAGFTEANHLCPSRRCSRIAGRKKRKSFEGM
ncbi:hypothetical protein ABIF53_007182 [Bradyrhizobium japonicum]